MAGVPNYMTKSGKNAQNTPYVKYSLHIRRGARKSKTYSKQKASFRPNTSPKSNRRKAQYLREQ